MTVFLTFLWKEKNSFAFYIYQDAHIIISFQFQANRSMSKFRHFRHELYRHESKTLATCSNGLAKGAYRFWRRYKKLKILSFAHLKFNLVRFCRIFKVKQHKNPQIAILTFVDIR